MAKKPITPTQRTVAHLKVLGYQVVEVVEHRIRGGKTKDLFGGDVLAVHQYAGIDPDFLLSIPAGRTRLVQCTSHSNRASRVKKLAKLASTPVLLAAGWDVEVWSWGDGDTPHVTRLREVLRG